jgi:hypothetical protein
METIIQNDGNAIFRLKMFRCEQCRKTTTHSVVRLTKEQRDTKKNNCACNECGFMTTLASFGT